MTNLPPGHPPIPARKLGLLLINLGTPEATDTASVRNYLREFLSDRRVIETNPLIWWFILNGVILNIRPSRSAHAYAKIWNHQKNESPLKTFTRAQSEKLAIALDAGDGLIVDWAMRYGKPAVGEKLREMKERGCERILLFPLYPQYSASTTASAHDKAYEQMAKMRWQPTLRSVPPYYDHPAYIDAIAGSLKSAMKNLAWKPDRVLIAFHGLPREYLDKGDPYHCHCQKTARLLREKLGFSKEFAPLVFQSRFGRTEWLKPYAKEMVEQLPDQGVKNLLMISPGFASDCVETLEELAIGLKETFTENGGQNFVVVPCLNDEKPSISMLARIVKDEMAGWLK